ncbi:AAA family ATPase [Nocardioides panacis]|uniref:AAA family ATPase n=1 Tax=Nocardioides panacis TaxID=2849501 RepID=A0A975T2F7_9ACTN|nr:AAA family ATPase [Nocardioides panacis]QWZ09654.1 AAA family ATPase [Nocardioides panacis]
MTSALPGPYLVLRETHCAGLLLVGDRALKFKKPVDLGFLDFSTRPLRAEACRREVELNQRFSPDVYLGVGEVSLPDGTREPIVVMRRMPDDRRLAHLVTRGVDVRDDLRALARRLAAVHAAGRRRPEIDEQASLHRLRARWEDSFRVVRAHLGPSSPGDVAAAVDEVERLATRFLDGRQVLFDGRVRSGCAVDGHGDLIADDVFCLPDGPRALDCLEFDDRLRFLDRLDDACFLAMDLEHLGAPDLGLFFVDLYAEFSGDDAPPALVHHYIAYRAFVRAKVAFLRGDQGVETSAEIAAYLGVAQRHLAAGAVTLVLVGGPPGSGKTTIGSHVADRLGMVLVGSDRVRKELAGLDPTLPAGAGFGSGLYTDAHTRRTYAELLRRAELLLGRGESVVLDATWTHEDDRRAARLAAERSRADLVEIRCATGPDLARERVETRPAGRDARSDADADVATRLRSAADRWPDACLVDTSGPLAGSVEDAVAAVRPAGVVPRPGPPRRRTFVTPD